MLESINIVLDLAYLLDAEKVFKYGSSKLPLYLSL